MKAENKKTLLLVEDEVLIAMGKQQELRKYGYNVITANTGEKAVAISRENHKIDLILMDTDLGSGIDGTVAAEQILKDRNIPVVFMSSHTEPEIVEKTEKTTSYGYVMKNSGITILDASIKMAFKLYEANEKLKMSELRFRTIFNEASLGIALTDSKSGYLYQVNSMFAKIAGRTIEEMDHIDWMSITHPDDIQKDLDNMALLNAGEIPGFQMEKRYLHKDGTVVWINMTITPIFVEDKAHPQNLCMIEDITKRKKLDTELEQYRRHLEKLVKERTLTLENTNKLLSKEICEHQIKSKKLELFSIVINNSPSMILITDTEGFLEYVNPKFTEISGYSADEVIGKHQKNIVYELLSEESYSEMQHSVLYSGEWHGEFRNKKKNGEIYWEHVSISSVKNSIDEITHFIAIKEDISKEKQAFEKNLLYCSHIRICL